MRPHSPEFYLAPLVQRVQRDVRADPYGGVPPSGWGYYPGTPAYGPTEAGYSLADESAQSVRWGRARDALAQAARMFGQDPIYLLALDWNDSDTVIEVSNAVGALADDCGIDWTETPWQDWHSFFNQTIGYGETWGDVEAFEPALQALIDTYCPPVVQQPEPPPTLGRTAPAPMPVAEPRIETAPMPTGPTVIPDKPVEPDSQLGWILGGAGLLLVVGLGVYYSTKRAR